MTVWNLSPSASFQFFSVVYLPRREIVGQRKWASLTLIYDLISLQSSCTNLHSSWQVWEFQLLHVLADTQNC